MQPLQCQSPKYFLVEKKNLISDPLPVKWSSKGKDYVCEATCKVTELIIRLPAKSAMFDRKPIWFEQVFGGPDVKNTKQFM